jgi:hypothetical protein
VKEGTKVALAKHLRNIHTHRDYAPLLDGLKEIGIGYCDVCKQARPLRADGALWTHKCVSVTQEEMEVQDESHAPEAAQGDEPWPAGIPAPPAGMPHPFRYAQVPVVVVVPLPNRDDWADVFARSASKLAKAVGDRNDTEIGLALDAWLRITDSLVKPKRGGWNAASKTVGKALRKALASENTGTYQESPLTGTRVYVPSDDESKRIARADSLVRRGWRSRAAKTLRSDDVMRHLEGEELLAFRAKFPPPRGDITKLEPPLDDDPLFVMDMDDFIETLKASFNGSAGGPSGLMGDHVRDILHYPRVQSALLRLFTLLIDGEFPLWTHPYICTQRVFALGEKARPVCVGEWMARTASKLCESRVGAKDSKDYFLHSGKGFKVLQFGTDVSGGMEAMVLIANTLVHQEGKARIVIKKDGTNAFNSSDRLEGVRVTSRIFPKTARWGKWYYGTPSILRMPSGDWMWGQEGFFQGDPYAGRAHDTLLQAALIQAAETSVQEYRAALAHRGVHRDPVSETGSLTDDDLVLLAFRDDVYTIGEAEIAMIANATIDTYREELTGVKENREKTSVYAPESAHVTNEAWVDALDTIRQSYIAESEISANGMKMVGAPVGDEAYCRDFLERASATYPHFLPRLSTMDTQIAKTLLRECHLPIYTHLIRIIKPDTIKPYARALDASIIETYLTIDDQHMDDWTAEADREVSQPYRLGGMGMRSVEGVSPIAFYAARVAAIKLILEDIDPTLRKHVQEFEPIHPLLPPPDPAGAQEGYSEEDLFGPDSPSSSPPSSAHSLPPQPQSQSPNTYSQSAHPASSTPVAGQQAENGEQDSENHANPHAHPASSASLAGQREDEREREQRAEIAARVYANVFTSELGGAWREVVYNENLKAILEVEGVSGALDGFPRSVGACCYGVLDAGPKLQNVLTKAVEDVKEHIHTTTRSQVEKVRAREAKAPGAKGACLAQPRTQDTTLPPDAMKFASTYRMGTASAPDIGHCPCGTGTPSITHILSCRSLRGRFVRHDVLVNVLVDMLRAIGITASAEVMILEGSQKRMDIVVTLASGRVWVDVSVVNPLIASYLNDKNPLVTRQKQKQEKYGVHARNLRVRFIPFVVSTFGGLGPLAAEFLKWIAVQAFEKGLIVAASGAEHATGQYRWGLTQRIGVAIAHANSCIVQEARARAVHPKARQRLSLRRC